MKPKIKEINYGIACRIGDIIYINKDLKKYPELYKRILQHEKEHSSGLKEKDIIMDLHNENLKGMKEEYYRFILSHPRSLTEFLPFGKYDGRVVLSPVMILFWTIGIILGGIIWKLLGIL